MQRNRCHATMQQLATMLQCSAHCRAKMQHCRSCCNAALASVLQCRTQSPFYNAALSQRMLQCRARLRSTMQQLITMLQCSARRRATMQRSPVLLQCSVRQPCYNAAFAAMLQCSTRHVMLQCSVHLYSAMLNSSPCYNAACSPLFYNAALACLSDNAALIHHATLQCLSPCYNAELASIKQCSASQPCYNAALVCHATMQHSPPCSTMQCLPAMFYNAALTALL